MKKISENSTIEIILDAWLANMKEATGFTYNFSKRGELFYIYMNSDGKKIPVAISNKAGNLFEAKPRNSFPNSPIDKGLHTGFIKTHPLSPL